MIVQGSYGIILVDQDWKDVCDKERPAFEADEVHSDVFVRMDEPLTTLTSRSAHSVQTIKDHKMIGFSDIKLMCGVSAEMTYDESVQPVSFPRCFTLSLGWNWVRLRDCISESAKLPGNIYFEYKLP